LKAENHKLNAELEALLSQSSGVKGKDDQKKSAPVQTKESQKEKEKEKEKAKEKTEKKPKEEKQSTSTTTSPPSSSSSAPQQQKKIADPKTDEERIRNVLADYFNNKFLEVDKDLDLQTFTFSTPQQREFLTRWWELYRYNISNLSSSVILIMSLFLLLCSAGSQETISSFLTNKAKDFGSFGAFQGI
jgi:hypothetical protein